MDFYKYNNNQFDEKELETTSMGCWQVGGENYDC